MLPQVPTAVGIFQCIICLERRTNLSTDKPCTMYYRTFLYIHSQYLPGFPLYTLLTIISVLCKLKSCSTAHTIIHTKPLYSYVVYAKDAFEEIAQSGIPQTVQ